MGRRRPGHLPCTRRVEPPAMSSSHCGVPGETHFGPRKGNFQEQAVRAQEKTHPRAVHGCEIPKPGSAPLPEPWCWCRAWHGDCAQPCTPPNPSWPHSHSFSLQIRIWGSWIRTSPRPPRLQLSWPLRDVPKGGPGATTALHTVGLPRNYYSSRRSCGFSLTIEAGFSK